MRALILAAGLGTRLGDLTRELPKPLLPLGGEPIIGHTLRYLARHGFREIAINLHFRPDLVREYVGDGRRFGVDVTWSHEPELLGTAGAVKRLEPYFASERDFLVMYGDVVTDHDLGALVRQHRATGAAATLLLHQRPGSNSRVEMADDGRIVDFVERPSDARPAAWVNSGVQVLGAEILGVIPDGPADLPRDVYAKTFDRLPLYGHPLTGYRVAIDSPERYAEAQRMSLSVANSTRRERAA